MLLRRAKGGATYDTCALEVLTFIYILESGNKFFYIFAIGTSKLNGF